jgi:hypothetical protein
MNQTGQREMTLLDLMQASRPPWGSKGLINRAGQAIRERRELTEEEVQALDAWRGAHKYVLNTFQANLRNRTRGIGIVVAQRLKRRHTIIDKLFREPRMELARMDDVAGCRMIFEGIPALDKFRGQFHKARFRHKRRNDTNKYNYIGIRARPAIEVSMTFMSIIQDQTKEDHTTDCFLNYSIGRRCSTRGPLI